MFIKRQTDDLYKLWKGNKLKNIADIIGDDRIFYFIDQLYKHKKWIFKYESAEDIILDLREQFAFLMYDGLQSVDRVSSQGLSINEVRQFSDLIDAKKETYENWRFRINWPLSNLKGGIKVDSYSDTIDWMRLLAALLTSSVPARNDEVASIFKALKRFVEKSKYPPKKLSGIKLFEEVSKSVQDSIQQQLGYYAYEQRIISSLGRSLLKERVDLILPAEYFTTKENHVKYKESQKSIAKFANSVCNYVLCSTYQISISQAIYLKKEKKIKLAMVCTARDTNKENLSIISEIPTVMLKGKKIIWFGQPDRIPTSEYLSHWVCHEKLYNINLKPKMIIHFHPIELIEIYHRLKEKYNDKILTKYWKIAQDVAGKKISLEVFQRYGPVRAREKKFGVFMAKSAIKLDNKTNRALIWKPNHGVWLIIDPIENKNENEQESKMQGILVEIEGIIIKITKKIKEKLNHKST